MSPQPPPISQRSPMYSSTAKVPQQGATPKPHPMHDHVVQGSPPKPHKSPDFSNFTAATAKHMSPVPAQTIPRSTSVQMSSEMSSAIVPESSKIILKVPMLLHRAGSNQEEKSLKFRVGTKDGTNLINLSYLRHKMDPEELEENGAVEYITLALPDDETQELVLCAIGCPSGPGSPLEGWLYLWGQEFFGTVKADAGYASFTLVLANGQPALTAMVQGSGGGRRMRIVSSQAREQTFAIVSPSDDRSGQNYDVECLPLSDINLVIVMLTAIDRMSVTAHRG